jgi:hypothetical protein
MVTAYGLGLGTLGLLVNCVHGATTSSPFCTESLYPDRAQPEATTMDFEEVIGMLLIGSVVGGVALLFMYSGFIL